MAIQIIFFRFKLVFSSEFFAIRNNNCEVYLKSVPRKNNDILVYKSFSVELFKSFLFSVTAS